MTPPPESERPVYRHAQMRRLVEPRSIAVVGASPRAGSFGLRTLQNLKNFAGKVYPVNGRYQDIEGERCYPKVTELPEVPDCVVLAVASDIVEEAMADCCAAGVGGVIIYASGFAEIREAAAVARQQRLVDMARRHDVRLLGPNSMGVTNHLNNAVMTFGRMPAPNTGSKRTIALVSQSGGLGMSLAQAMERGLSVSHTLTVGNASDATIADFVSYLAEEPRCHAIACVFEGIGDPQRLLQAAEIAWQADKPVIVYKMATGERGAAAALSHTGTLAGSQAGYRATFERGHFICVDRLEDVMETAAFFAKAGPATGPAIAVMTTSGGGAVMAADKAESNNVPLPPPGSATLAVLEQHIPEFGSRSNPCDLTAQVLNNESSMGACADALLADPTYAALVVHHPFADAVSSRRLPVWQSLAERHGKIVCNYWSAEWLEGPGNRESEESPGIATFRSLDRCFATLGAWLARAAARNHPAASAAATPAAVRERVAGLLRGKTGALGERESKALLAEYGVPVTTEAIATSADEAAHIAAGMGGAVAMKLESPDVLHKTDAGVVMLNVSGETAVRAAHQAILGRAALIRPAPRINGVLIQPMIEQGVEIIVGGVRDPLFGPMITVGVGGIFVELLRDAVTSLAPVSPEEALRMLARLRSQRLLDGFRGLPPVDRATLAGIVSRISALVADHAGTIAEVDVNPLICHGERIVAVDGLIVTGVAPQA